MLFHDNACRIRTGANAKRENHFSFDEKHVADIKKVLVLVTRFAEDEARERGLLKKGDFLKIDAFYGKMRILRENALLEPRGEKV